MRAKGIQQFSGIQSTQALVKRFNLIDIPATGEFSNILSGRQRTVRNKCRRQGGGRMVNNTMEQTLRNLLANENVILDFSLYLHNSHNLQQDSWSGH